MVITLVAALIFSLLPDSARATGESSEDRLVATFGSTAGFVIINNTWQWIDASCRTDLEADGHVFASMSWKDISARTRAKVRLSCEEIVAHFGHTDAGRFVHTGPDRDSGWFLQAGTKQWLSPDCRRALAMSGVTFHTTTYSTFRDFSRPTSLQPCESLINEYGQPSVPHRQIIAPADTDDSSVVAVSADDRLVLINSSRNNLVPGDTDGVTDAFLYDTLDEQFTQLVPAADGPVFASGMTSDGRYVLLHSSATNLVIDDRNDRQDVFRLDTLTGQVILVSVDSDGSQFNIPIEPLSMSDDGNVIAFDTRISTGRSGTVLIGAGTAWRIVDAGVTRFAALLGNEGPYQGGTWEGGLTDDGQHIVYHCSVDCPGTDPLQSALYAESTDGTERTLLYEGVGSYLDISHLDNVLYSIPAHSPIIHTPNPPTTSSPEDRIAGEPSLCVLGARVPYDYYRVFGYAADGRTQVYEYRCPGERLEGFPEGLYVGDHKVWAHNGIGSAQAGTNTVAFTTFDGAVLLASTTG